MTAQNQDVDFIKGIATTLVDFPEAVEVTRSVDEMGVLLTLKVDKRDMGKIIGKKGRIVGAMRTLLGALGMKLRARINLKIYEPEDMERDNSYETVSSVSEDPTNVGDLVS